MIIAIIKETDVTCYYLVLSENESCEELEAEYSFLGESDLEDCPVYDAPSGETCDKEVIIYNDESGRNYRVKPIVVYENF